MIGANSSRGDAIHVRIGQCGVVHKALLSASERLERSKTNKQAHAIFRWMLRRAEPRLERGLVVAVPDSFISGSQANQQADQRADRKRLPVTSSESPPFVLASVTVEKVPNAGVADCPNRRSVCAVSDGP